MVDRDTAAAICRQYGAELVAGSSLDTRTDLVEHIKDNLALESHGQCGAGNGQTQQVRTIANVKCYLLLIIYNIN